ncbi:ABC transporter ATP-binding protein [Streptomyces filipinensis]|uniref:ABC transporter ATP-binding protein n=1 Tax=Streptomyces filipinensis TaxID=66887 RepID=A0A918ID19_9ACTN|nr:ATP-binding cassette domain-containing protein [Streptomyces filipinensis]GGV02249.1 ABC transporter ATP-binding protein [Streptomyces filipinensis]
MGHLEASRIAHLLPDGTPLLSEASFRVGEGAKVALVGSNGSGKTTLLRIMAGELQAHEGTVVRSGALGYMPQMIGALGDDVTVGDLLVSVSAPAVAQAARSLADAEDAMILEDTESAQLRYAQALSDWGDIGGYEAEVHWDVCTRAALGRSFQEVRHRSVTTLSGGEQKRLALEALLRGRDEVLLLDEPDNYLDVPAKQWLEQALRETPKTVLFISHDRELLTRTADRIVTVEGGSVWSHGGGFEGYHEARRRRHERMEELLRRWQEEHKQLRTLVHTLREQARISDDMASRYRAAQTRLHKFEAAGPPEAPPVRESLSIRLAGGRTGVRAVVCEGLELTGLTRPFDCEIHYGERVAVLGANGSGKSHFLRLLGGAEVAHGGDWRLGARVAPGLFVQTQEHPHLAARTLAEILWAEHSCQRGQALSALRRYGLHKRADDAFGVLSGGQRARFQILCLELSGATLLLLDEPTDNLDVDSAEALEEALSKFQGTVLAVTHDRWFARQFDRFLVFGSEGTVYESTEPVWTGQGARARRQLRPVG